MHRDGEHTKQDFVWWVRRVFVINANALHSRSNTTVSTSQRGGLLANEGLKLEAS